MGFKNTFELITKDIQDIENLVSNFQNSSNLSAIELDLMLSKLRNVYDLILMIKSHENKNEVRLEKEVEESPETEEVKNEVKPSAVLEKEVEKEIFTDHPEQSPIETEPEPLEIHTSEDQSDIQNKQNQKVKIVSDKFEKSGEYLNEKIGPQSEILSRKMQSGPIESIAGSIGINDKFYFARELFHGKADDFKKAVDILDKAANFNEAYNYISNHFSWDMNDESVQNLLNLVRRKFISSNNE
ncbi:MAG: hypothetical protein K9H49_00355 [Bacteroidales bacterium]|nr:hypothetical protein [Bacteroidales bacterium]MCF8389305.1 hypothetical protein [Bacteroidales bacterium]